jgi:hypothetical protein
MATKPQDVIQDEDVLAKVDKIRNQYTQVRRAFRSDDRTNADSDTFSYPVSDDDFDGEVVEVGAGEDFPRSDKSYSKVQAVVSKYGVEIAITDEAVEDSKVNVEMDQEEDAIRGEERRIEEEAFNVLDANTNSAGPIDAGNAAAGVIEQPDLELAKEQALSDELSQNDLIVIGSAQDYSDYVGLDGFTRASELGDQVAQTGVLSGDADLSEGFMGVALDMPVYLENIGNISSGDAYVVDTSNFGWETTRRAMNVDSYREEQKEQRVWQADGRWDWVATQSTANIKIDS